MSKLTGAALDRAVANAIGLKSVNNCEQWGEEHMTSTGHEPTYTWSEVQKQIETAVKHDRKQRTWVGLTDEDDIDWEEGDNLRDLVKAIEAKLKEKNT